METVLAGHYQVVRPLGGGGFGQTFLARDSHLPGKPLCVVKQLKPRSQTPNTLEVAKRMFEREAGTLYRLGNHPQIPRLLAHFEQDNEFYLVQEYIAGQPLDKELTPGTQLTETDVISLLRDILQVLGFVHQQRVIHRDIKPSNLIRRSKDGKIVLIDFGAVKQVSSQAVSGTGQTSLTIAIGSPGYMPSEQQCLHPHFSSDIYAVGIVCFQALTGLSPKLLPKNNATNEICCEGLGDRLVVSPGLAAILDRMVRYDYRQRFSNAGEALKALQGYLNSASVITLPIAGETSTETLVQPAAAPSSEPISPQAPPSFDAYSAPQSLPDEVKKRIARLLAEAIGPIASVILNNALTKAESLPHLFDLLAQRVPEPGRSQFCQSLNLILSGVSITTPSNPSQGRQVTLSPSGMDASPVVSALTPEFIKQCEQELAKKIGPIAPLLTQRIVTKHPNYSPSELANALVEQVQNPTAAAQLRQTLLALIEHIERH